MCHLRDPTLIVSVYALATRKERCANSRASTVEGSDKQVPNMDTCKYTTFSWNLDPNDLGRGGVRECRLDHAPLATTDMDFVSKCRQGPTELPYIDPVSYRNRRENSTLYGRF